MSNKKSILIFAILISNLFSCISIPSNLQKNYTEYTQAVELKSISIEPLDTVLKQGEEKILTALLYTEDNKVDNSNTNVEWSSEDPSIVSVDKYGKIKAIKSGEVGILAKYKYGNSIRRSIVKVVGKKIIDSIIINKNLVELKPEDNFSLSATVYMADGTKNSNVIWSSSDNTIASVDDNGNVTAKKIGLTTIVATYTLDNIYKKSVDVNITKEGQKIVEEVIKPIEKIEPIFSAEPPKPILTPIPTSISTSIEIFNPIVDPTPTSTPVSTPITTQTPTNTPVSTPVPTSTPTSTPVSTPVPTSTPTSTPVSTPIPTFTPTSTPVSTVNVTTIAGSGVAGLTDGTGSNAQISDSYGVSVDSSGNVYFTENHRIRKITPSGIVTTLAGNGVAGFVDGTGSNAQFSFPRGIAIDSSGNIFVADMNNNRIRKVTQSGVVTTIAGNGVTGFADGTATTAQFYAPFSLTVDSFGNIYVGEGGASNRIRKITPSGIVTTLAGNGVAGFADGTGSNAQFSFPRGIAIDSSGNIFVADMNNNRIRKVTQSGVVTTIAGTGELGNTDGIGSIARFRNPSGVAVDTSGNIFVADLYNYKIREVTQSGVVITLAGSRQGFADGTVTNAQFNYPTGIAIDTSGNIYVADTYNYRIRKIR